MCITKEQFESIFTPENRFNDNSEYKILLNHIETIIKTEEGHSSERYIDNVFYDQLKNRFEIDIYIYDDTNALVKDEDEIEPNIKYYSISEIIPLLDKYPINL